MGETAKKIIQLNISELLNILNEAYAEEWLAYYQYWIGAKLITGQFKKDIETEFLEHAKEELEHADMLANRILQLGGTPLINPDDWSKLAKCKYLSPTQEDSLSLVKQNLASERCAADKYHKICEMCFGKDHETFKIAEHILAQELEHEQEMEDFLTDMETAKKYFHS